MNRNYGLDLARISAAYMVMAGHLIYGGGLATGRPYSDWAGSSEKLPLLQHNLLWKFDSYLLSSAGTALAIIGVSLFFLISGWLMPAMLEKYSRGVFLVNRILRIFPMLVVAVVMAALIQYFFGDKSTLDILGVALTATLTNGVLEKPLSLGVVWTLVVEFKFYILLSLLGKLSQFKILAACCAVMMATLTYTIIRSEPFTALADLNFIIYMMIGCSSRLVYDKYKSDGWSATLILAPILALGSFKINQYLLIEELKITPTQTINNYSITITIFLFIVFSLAGKQIATRKLARRIIGQASDLTYSLYLTHLALGIFLLSRLRHILPNDYLTLAITFLIVSLFSAFTYYSIERPGMMIFRRVLKPKSVL